MIKNQKIQRKLDIQYKEYVFKDILKLLLIQLRQDSHIGLVMHKYSHRLGAELYLKDVAETFVIFIAESILYFKRAKEMIVLFQESI